MRIALAAAGLSLGAVPALAQTVPQQTAPATTNTTTAPTDSVGPRALQNFSLDGTVTRRADPATAPAPATAAPREAPSAAAAEAPARSVVAPTATRTARTEGANPAPPPAVERSVAATPSPAPSSAAPAPAAPAPSPSSSLAAAAPSLGPITDQSALTSQPKVALWPWLLAAIALGAGGAFLFWRNRRQEAFAGGPQYDAFVAPEPAARPMPRPAPKPAPAPPTAAPRPAPAAQPPAATPAPEPAAQPSIPGTITTRLRPTVEIQLNPGRFIVEDDKIAVELEIELVNSGNAPARGVLIEASLMNAGNEQDDQLRGFFANPVGQGQRIVAIPPLQRVMIKTQVSLPRTHVQEFEIAGKKVCVPLIALNTLYSWAKGEGQTSVAYLIGRDTEGGKLAPFRLDLGPRLFRGVGLRQLPNTFRK